MKFKLDTFTQGEDNERNEDCLGYTDNKIVLSDGSTDKTGRLYDKQTGGEIISRMIVDHFLNSDKDFNSTLEELNKKINKFYSKNNPEALKDDFYKFSGTLLFAELSENLTIYKIADSGFRINAKEKYQKDHKIDILTSQLRARYIELTGDKEGSREFILPILKKQHVYCNNPDHPLGYGAINGDPIDSKFIQKYEFSLKDITSVEIFSDGYYDVPDKASIESWEKMYSIIEKEDPFKYKKYKSTKVKDDRSIIIAKI